MESFCIVTSSMHAHCTDDYVCSAADNHIGLSCSPCLCCWHNLRCCNTILGLPLLSCCIMTAARQYINLLVIMTCQYSRSHHTPFLPPPDSINTQTFARANLSSLQYMPLCSPMQNYYFVQTMENWLPDTNSVKPLLLLLEVKLRLANTCVLHMVHRARELDHQS